ncbi:MAG: hypothetical protein NT096_01620 [Proteobacteria bacterium]|nr:hypothetical protein [Pseudomonadota bacterium]
MTEEQKEMNEIEVEGILIKPWTFGQLVSLKPTFQEISVELKKSGITGLNLKDNLVECGLIANDFSLGVKFW